VWTVSDIVRQGRLRSFRHLERKSNNDWVSKCREIEVVGVKGRGISKKTWGECVGQLLKLLGMNNGRSSS